VHYQPSSKETLLKIIDAEKEGRDADLVMLKDSHRSARNRENMRKKRAIGQAGTSARARL
jgi:hypothetical protein